VGEVSESVQLTDEQRIDWLRLIRSPNVAPRGIMAQTPQGLACSLIHRAEVAFAP
jgi:hypothetical protein